jgi:hypothetical protein
MGLVTAKMSYPHGTAIETIETQDGTRKVDIVGRNDGRFQAHEFVRLSAEDGGGWGVGRMSGLYESAERAELAARSDFNLSFAGFKLRHHPCVSRHPWSTLAANAMRWRGRFRWADPLHVTSQ